MIRKQNLIHYDQEGLTIQFTFGSQHHRTECSEACPMLSTEDT